MERLLDCLMDFASRNGLSARPSGQQATPLRGALRVHNLPTPAGFRLENAGAFPTPRRPKVYQQQQLFEIGSYGYGGAALAAFATPLDGTQATSL